MLSTEFKLEYKEIKSEGKITAIIVAAGSSTRMKGADKQFISLEGKSVISRTIEAFENCKDVSNIVVVTKKDSILKVQQEVEKYHFKKITDIVEGGNSRDESVKNGVNCCPDSDILLIHDGARPLISEDIISAVVSSTEIYGAAACGVPVKNTIKIIEENGFIISTPDRSTLLEIQTPQGFKADIYKKALEMEKPNGVNITDDCMLVELLGEKVFTVMGSYENIKITTSEDVLFAESILKKRKGKVVRIGHGYDVHKFAENRKLILGGVEIPYEKGLLGHSDADVLLHAISDAILGAAALKDIGYHFPDTASEFEGIDSRMLLRKVVSLINEKGYKIGNIDATIIAQKPKMAPHIEKMIENVAKDCSVEINRINIKATTEEGLGFTGELLGISAHAVCMIEEI